MPEFKQAEHTFLAHLDEVSSCTIYIKRCREVRTLVLPSIRRDEGTKYAFEVCEKFVNHSIDFERSLINGLYLFSAACFEQFIRELLTALIEKKVSQNDIFEDIGETLRLRHIKETGKLLARVHEPPHHLSALDFYQVCKKLGSCHPGSTDFSFVTEALCLQSNITELVYLFETAEAFSLEMNWEAIGKNKAIAEALNINGSAKYVGNALEEYLKDMRRIRNRLAHAGSAASDLTFEELNEQTNVLKALTNILCTLARKN